MAYSELPLLEILRKFSPEMHCGYLGTFLFVCIQRFFNIRFGTCLLLVTFALYLFDEQKRDAKRYRRRPAASGSVRSLRKLRQPLLHEPVKVHSAAPRAVELPQEKQALGMHRQRLCRLSAWDRRQNAPIPRTGPTADARHAARTLRRRVRVPRLPGEELSQDFAARWRPCRL